MLGLILLFLPNHIVILVLFAHTHIFLDVLKLVLFYFVAFHILSHINLMVLHFLVIQIIHNLYYLLLMLFHFLIILLCCLSYIFHLLNIILL